ncbi:MAG: S8 family peptidase [Bacteroidia bacterium]
MNTMKWILMLATFLLCFGFAQKPDSPWAPDRVYIHVEPEFATNSKGQNWQEVATLSFLHPYIKQDSLERLRCAFPGLELPYIYELQFLSKKGPQYIKEQLESLPEVRLVEAVPYVHSSFIPNDLDSVRDYHLPLIDAPGAWDISRGDSGTLIAVVDNAVMINHEDLQAAIWHNPGEIPFDNIDNDGNGWVDDTTGWDVADEDGDPSPPTRTFRHGTHIAGLIAASADNGKGAPGLAHHCSLLPVKVASSSAFADNYPLSDALRGVAYAAVTGAHVICMAWGGTDSLLAAHLLMERARQRDIVLVAAAGNGPGDNNPNTTDSTLEYPASYQAVVSVAASDALDQKAAFATANRRVSICAPGDLLYSTSPSSALNSSYSRLRGSSQATAVASAAFGLLRAARPCLNADEVEAIMLQSCVNIDTLNPGYIGRLGAGRLDVGAALRASAPAGALRAHWVIPDSVSCSGRFVPVYTEEACPDSIIWQGADGVSRREWHPRFEADSSGPFSLCLWVWKNGQVDSFCNEQYVRLVDAIQIIPGDTVFKDGDSLRLEVDGPGGLYTWEPLGLFKTSAAGWSIWAFPVDTTEVVVRLTGLPGCDLSDTIRLDRIAPDGVEPFERDGVILYPNPVGRRLRIRIKGNEMIDDVSLYDLKGRRISRLVAETGRREEFVLPEKIPSGTYLLDIHTNRRVIRKLVRVR